MQVTSFSLFVGKSEVAKKIIESVKQKRVATQIEPDGSQPLEIARTRSLSYSTMNLEAFILLAKLGDATGIDIWNFQTKDGRSIRMAIDFLYPYANGEKKWATKQIVEFETERLFAVMRLAVGKYGDDQFRKMMSSLPKAAKFDPRAPLGN